MSEKNDITWFQQPGITWADRLNKQFHGTGINIRSQFRSEKVREGI